MTVWAGMSLTRWAILVAVVALAVGILDLIVGLPVLRSAGYHAITQEFARAIPLQPTPGADRLLKWNVDVPLSNGTSVRVQARDHMDVVKVHYSDESEARELYDYEDYSNPEAIRVAGKKLLVYWSETLLHTDSWLLAYDLENRREIERRRVDSRDIAASP